MLNGISVSLPKCQNLELTEQRLKPGAFLGLRQDHHYYVYLGSDAVLMYAGVESGQQVYDRAGWTEFRKAKDWHVCLPA